MICLLFMGPQAWSTQSTRWPCGQIQEVCQKWTHQNRIPKQKNKTTNNNNNNSREQEQQCVVPMLFSVMANGNTTGKIIMLYFISLTGKYFYGALGGCRWISFFFFLISNMWMECELDRWRKPHYDNDSYWLNKYAANLNAILLCIV